MWLTGEKVALKTRKNASCAAAEKRPLVLILGVNERKRYCDYSATVGIQV